MNTALRCQQTLVRAAEVTGFGYWSGRDVTVRFLPAPPNTGFVFVRTDLPGAPRIPAHPALRIETPRRTTLRLREAQVEMVEHVLAALGGLRIDNCEVQVDAPELPGCDGSSQPFVAALSAAGVEVQTALRPRLVVTETTRVGDQDCWVEARPSPSDELRLRYRLDYGSDSPIGRETFELTLTPESFATELAPARTFLLKAEADWLRERGLASRATTADLLVFGDDGPLDNTLRFPNECVRHKLLDLVGDLALAGSDLVGRIAAHRSGHRLNAELARALLTEGRLERAA